MKNQLRFLIPFGIICLLSACAPKASTTTPKSAETYFPLQVDDQTIQLQLALNDSERSRGLMDRDHLGKDQGMLFLFEKPAQRSFWMRNTHIPLDIGYFNAQGKLLEIYALYPHDDTSIPSYSKEILIAVETNQGWYQQNQVEKGAQLDLMALQTAVQARGYNPDNFSLQTNPQN